MQPPQPNPIDTESVLTNAFNSGGLHTPVGASPVAALPKWDDWSKDLPPESILVGSLPKAVRVESTCDSHAAHVERPLEPEETRQDHDTAPPPQPDAEWSQGGRLTRANHVRSHRGKPTPSTGSSRLTTNALRTHETSRQRLNPPAEHPNPSPALRYPSPYERAGPRMSEQCPPPPDDSPRRYPEGKEWRRTRGVDGSGNAFHDSSWEADGRGKERVQQKGSLDDGRARLRDGDEAEAESSCMCM